MPVTLAHTSKNVSLNIQMIPTYMELREWVDYSQNCVAARVRSDGFNHHVYNDVVPDVIEVDCIVSHTGLEANQTMVQLRTMEEDLFG